MNYEKDGEDYVARREDGEVALRYLKAATAFRATAFEVLREHHEIAPLWTFSGGLTPRDEKLHGPISQRIITLKVHEDRKTPLRAIPPKPWQSLGSTPIEVVLRHDANATGNVFYSEDERFGPTPTVQITCYVEREIIDRLWADMGDRPEAKVSVEVLADLYQEDTELKYNESEHTDHLFYAPGDWSLTDPYPHKVHGVSVMVADNPRPPFDVEKFIADGQLEPAKPRPIALRQLLSTEFATLRKGFNLIAFLLAATAAAVIFK